MSKFQLEEEKTTAGKLENVDEKSIQNYKVYFQSFQKHSFDDLANLESTDRFCCDCIYKREEVLNFKKSTIKEWLS